MLNEETPKELLGSIISKISEVMAIMDNFQDSRPGSLAFTKLEEAIMWLQVMAHNAPLKPKPEENNIENVNT